MTRSRRLRLALAGMGLLLAVTWGFSRALDTPWARRILLSHLSASFGRPVEVGRFGFSLLSAPRLSAFSVTVGEDLRFGNEYFLRSERLTASLRWSALLRGHLEFDTLSFTRPSLNLVRSPEGTWNIESWLPPVTDPPPVLSAGGPPPPAPTPPAARFTAIEIDGGRINFKRGPTKLSFALVGVAGRVDEEGAGRWRIDLEAAPWRTSVALQQAGTVRLRGVVAGTSLRLRPASLTVSWRQASLADAMRLAHGSDFGLRGALEGEIFASIGSPFGTDAAFDEDTPASSLWRIAGAFRLTGVHRWDLPRRAADPSLGVKIEAAWRPGEPRVEFTELQVESRRSQLTAAGRIDWSHGFEPFVEIASSQIGFSELLDWRAAFLPGMGDDLDIDGSFTAEARLAGWPLRVESAAVSSDGAAARLRGLRDPIRLGAFHAVLRRGLLIFPPVDVSLPAAPVSVSRGRAAAGEPAAPASSGGRLSVEGALGPIRSGESPRDWAYRLAVSGETQRVQDLLAVAAALGRPAASSWTVEGPAELRVISRGRLREIGSALRGTVTVRQARLMNPALAQPVSLASARLEFRPGERHVTLSEAAAFGAGWSGALHWREGDDFWTFDLTADHLDVDEVDRWIIRPERPGFIARMIPFASRSRAGGPERLLAGLAARGRLRVAEISALPLRLERLDAQAELDGPALALRDADADFYDGAIAGEFEARLSDVPSYAFRGRVDRADLGQLAEVAPLLADRLEGATSGELSLTAAGTDPQELLASLEGEGVLRVRNAVIHAVPSPARGEDGEIETVSQPADVVAGSGTARFQIAGGRVSLDPLLLASGAGNFEAEGTVGLDGELDLHIYAVGASPAVVSDAGEERDGWVVAGTVDAPVVTFETRLVRVRPAPAP